MLLPSCNMALEKQLEKNEHLDFLLENKSENNLEIISLSR